MTTTNEEIAQVTEEDIEAAQPEPIDYAGGAYNLLQTYATVSEIDVTLLTSRQDKRRVDQMKRYSLRIAHKYIKALYDENFTADNDEG